MVDLTCHDCQEHDIISLEDGACSFCMHEEKEGVLSDEEALTNRFVEKGEKGYCEFFVPNEIAMAFSEEVV